MRVLVTRPEFDALRTARRLKALGHEAVVDPLLKIEAMEFEPIIGRYDGVVITSTNAIRAVNEKTLAALRSLPLYAVGVQSSEAGREAGFREVQTGGGDAVALAAMLKKSFTRRARLLYLAGAARAQDLALLVKDAGIEIEMRAVYRAVPATRLGENTVAFLRDEEIDAALHYSRRSAKNFVALLEKEKLLPKARTLRHLCISDMAAAPLRSADFRVKIAHEPDEDALFALLD
jgi:uroporphyrinogen-III synthase